MTLEDLEQEFSRLSEITDRIALMNSDYDSDLETAFRDLETFSQEVMTWNLDAMESHVVQFYLSHMSFHREIVSDIIDEARTLLIEERRSYLKQLVNYHKDFSRWFNRVERQYAA